MFGKHIRVTAAGHGCENIPISTQVPSDRGDEAAPGLMETKTGRQVPGQVMVDSSGNPRLTWIVDELRVGQTREYELSRKVQAPASSGVELVDLGDGRVQFHINGELFTAYHYGGDIVRPFLYPVVGPGGKGVTRDYPMVNDIPGETSDHPHHRSIWVAHGDVNGADDWSEGEGHAYIKHAEFLEKSSGPVFGRVKMLNDWVDDQGRKLLEEERTVTVYNVPDSGRIIDLDVVFHATEGNVKFGDTKEGGIASVRVATTMDGDKGGLIINSYGGVTEAETWGKRAQWCDYSGPVEGRTVGITIFDHPSNFRHPTYWHVRDYGLMTANPFALSAYKNDPGIDGSRVVKSGERFAFSYRIFIHDGDAQEADVAEKYHGYINPPVVAVE